MDKFDVIVIGSGPGGGKVAVNCVKAGKKVAVIDGLFGGTCALRGCTPKRAMEAVTSIYWEAKDAEKIGFSKVKPVDWKALMTHKSKFTALVPGTKKKKYKEQGIEIIQGYASFADPHTLIANEKKYQAKKIVIATGAKPRPLDFPGSEFLVTSRDFFELDELPKKIAIIGGGYIGFELSHIIAACGSQVTIVSGADMPLNAFDSSLVNTLVQATLDKGIDVRLGFAANKVKKVDGQYVVYADREGDQTIEIAADLVIHAAGRVPATAHLNTEAADIELDKGGAIKVNDFLQVPNHEHIYALGDVIGKLPFTDVASYEASIVEFNLYAERRKRVNYHGVPMAVFTHPKMAMVGKKEAECEDEYYVREASLRSTFLQRCKANKFARYKTIVRKSDKQVIGAHMLGYNADEAINMFAVAMQMNINCDQMNDLFLAYPTAIHDTKHLL